MYENKLIENKIIIGDCIEKMRKIKDNTFTMVFADPPFNLNKKYSTCDDNLKEEDYLNWSCEWMEQMLRITKPNGSVFIHNIPKWLAHYTCFLNDKLHFKHWIAWDAPTSPMGKSLQPAHYGILYYVKDSSQCKFYEVRIPHKRCRDKKCQTLLKDYGGKKDTIHPFGPLLSDVWTDIHRYKHNCYMDDHPCQLPSILLERIILMCTDEGDSVFDPFAGTGTTLIAAKRLGRNYCGIEMDRRYAELCRKKLNKEVIDSRLDDFWVSCYIDKVWTVRNCDLEGSVHKGFSQKWKDLYENWPESGDDRKKLNTTGLVFRKDIKERIKKLCQTQK